jgi:hypothetical protein
VLIVSQPSPETVARTRAFARVIGPFVALATLIVAIRLPDLTGLVNDLFANAVLPWILGAMMLVCGLIVIAFHQDWSSVAAVLISLFGWFVALRGLALIAFPSAIQAGADETTINSGLLIAARIFFLLLTVMGLWLTYVGWISRSATEVAGPVDNFSAAPAKSVSMRNGKD